MSGQVISLVNQKGGVAKTTSSLSIAYSLANHFNKKVLLIDLDPQGNASSMFSEFTNQKKTIYEVLTEKNHINDVIVKTDSDNLNVIIANNNLSAIERDLMNEFMRESILLNHINKVKNKYDFIILDCPPSLSLITINALTASDYVLVPMIGEIYSLEGFASLYGIIQKVQEKLNSNLEILGLFLALYDNHVKIHKLFYDKLKDNFDDLIFETKIPKNITLPEAANNFKNIFDFSKKSKGAVSYNKLTEEILQKLDISYDKNLFLEEDNNDVLCDVCNQIVKSVYTDIEHNIKGHKSCIKGYKPNEIERNEVDSDD
jgi:chromosome partitioning protein